MLVALALSLQVALAPSAAPLVAPDTLAGDGPVHGWHGDLPAVAAWEAPALDAPAIPAPAAHADTAAIPAGPVVVATRVGLAMAPIADSAATARRASAPPAVEHSDWYYRRLAWHRTLSWAMVPLFIGSYVSGSQLLDKGTDAPTWARRSHPVFAGGSAAVFGANAITGVWNLVEGWKEKEGRTKRLLHTVAMTVASAGFVYAGSIGEEARDNGAIRDRHRTVALSSMGLSTVSWLFMLLGK